ncbi:dTDP-4-dehydrorhamnose 3,5-epimerase [candidate division KSB1 bacterium]|nr:dTDP-4-dehydrorhamnose 3,5-epimerase [candidate division KSB1 bacterium]
MEVVNTRLAGVVLIKPEVFSDQRGFFFESYNYRRYAAAGIEVEFVQDNHSKSAKNTLRGLHYQVNPGQGKLIHVVAGEIFDVVVDIRWKSPTFGQWIGETLSAENKHQLLVPIGFAHGFLVLSEYAEVIYKCTHYYAPADERGIRWNDPDLAIQWPANAPLLSNRDQHHPDFKSIGHDF